MNGVYYYPASALRVCVDQLTGATISGRAYCPQQADPIVFGDLGLFLLLADEALDRRGYPLAFQKKRSLLDNGGRNENTLFLKTRPLPRQSEQVIDVSAMRGARCTFLVHILSRRNTSWQGRIDWIDEGGFDTFSSELMFLKKVRAHFMEMSADYAAQPELY